ncbi:hypothetical protein CCACVL1_01074, partial [Corchorus capsularis]
GKNRFWKSKMGSSKASRKANQK